MADCPYTECRHCQHYTEHGDKCCWCESIPQWLDDKLRAEEHAAWDKATRKWEEETGR